MLEDLNRPHTWGGSRRQHQSHFVAAPQLPPPLPSIVPTHIQHPAPVLPVLPPPPPAVPQPPRIIQQTVRQSTSSQNHPNTLDLNSFPLLSPFSPQFLLINLSFMLLISLQNNL